MTEFGVEATTLSAPQGAGAQVLQPVTPPNTTGAMLEAASGILDIFARGMNAKNKEAAEQRRRSVISQYVADENAISQAFETGQINAQVASSRSQLNFKRYAGGYSEYIDDLVKAGQALKGFTAKGTVEDEMKLQQKIEEDDIKQAQNRGYMFFPNMSREARQDAIAASKAAIRAEQELDAYYKRREFERQDTRFTNEMRDRQDKEMSVKIITDIAGTQLQSFQSFSASLSDEVRKGTMAPDQARILLAERFTNISSAIQAAAGQNPELATPYRTIFNELNDVSKLLIDPKAANEDVKAQFENLVNRARLLAVSRNPKVLAAVATSQLLPNSTEVALSVAPQATEAFALIANTPLNGVVNPVVGNPEIEGDVYKILKEGIKKIEGGKIGKKDIAELEASNSLNHILKQTNSLLDRGLPAAQYSKVAELLADPAVGRYMASGKVDPEAMLVAKRVLQLNWENTVKRGISQELSKFLNESTSLVEDINSPGGVRVATRSEQDPSAARSLGQVVDIQWNGTGVTFAPKNTESLDATQRRDLNIRMQTLNKSQTALNQLIRVGAHMEGTTDYAKYWKENRHKLLPDYFPEPQRLKLGQVVDGYEFFQDGDPNDKRNWRKVESTAKQ